MIHADPTTVCDCTAQRLLVPEHIIPTWKTTRDAFRESLSAAPTRYRVVVRDREFLVAKPTHNTLDKLGHGTRGLVALDWATQEFVFLKDAWHGCRHISEGDILGKLNNAGVRNIPTLVCDECLPHQVTLTDKHERYATNGSLTYELSHYRMVEKEVCLPSTEYDNGKHLVEIILDSVRGTCF